MRRPVAILAWAAWTAATTAPRIAVADDPRATFGLAPAPPPAPSLDCSDGLAFGCPIATDPFADASPYGLTTHLPTDYLRALPAADATYDAVASHVLGGGSDGAGPSFAGATGLENRWTIDGAPTDDLRTGAAQSQVPLIFLAGITVATGGFTARDRASTGATIDGELIRGGDTARVDSYVWLTYPTASPALPPVPGAYSVRTGSLDLGPELTAAVVASGPLARVGGWLGGRAWYAAGIAPKVSLDTFHFTAQELIDGDGDGVPDGSPGVLATHPIEATQQRTLPYFIPAMLRAGLDRGVHHVELTVLGQLAESTRTQVDATLPASGVDQLDFVGDAIASDRIDWPDTHVHLQASYHDDLHGESAQTASAANLPQHVDGYIPAVLTDDPALAAACAATRTAFFEPCPVTAGAFLSGGAGELTNVDAARATWSADVAHRFGINLVRVGATEEDTDFVQTQRFTGGEQVISPADGELDTHRFLAPGQPCDPGSPTLPCGYADSSQLDWHTRYAAGYVEDTLTLAPGVVADAGLRYEDMLVASAFDLREPAPRLGVSWDMLGDHTSRMWVSMGRSYPLLPAGIGAVVDARAPTVDDVVAPSGSTRTIDTGAPPAIAPGLVAPHQDELTAGTQLALLERRLAVTAWLQGRYYHDGFDTVLGTFENPGQVNALTPEAERETEQVGLELQTSPTAPFAVRIGWSWGRTLGSWTGPYDPREGITLYNSADYNTGAQNLSGTLPTSAGNRFYAEHIARGHIHGIAAGVATRLTLSSGLPRDVLGDSDVGIVELLPRGAGGTDPMVSEVDVRLFARLAGFDVQLEVFDLFDQRTATSTDEVYAGGGQQVRPIDGGDYSDLIWLHDDDGSVTRRNPGYTYPTAYQPPLALVLGVHRAF